MSTTRAKTPPKPILNASLPPQFHGVHVQLELTEPIAFPWGRRHARYGTFSQ